MLTWWSQPSSIQSGDSWFGTQLGRSFIASDFQSKQLMKTGRKTTVGTFHRSQLITFHSSVIDQWILCLDASFLCAVSLVSVDSLRHLFQSSFSRSINACVIEHTSFNVVGAQLPPTKRHGCFLLQIFNVKNIRRITAAFGTETVVIPALEGLHSLRRSLPNLISTR